MTNSTKMNSDLVRTRLAKRFESYECLVRREVSRMLGGRYAPEDVDDVVQEALLSLVERESPTDDGVVVGSARYAALRFLEAQPSNEVLESELLSPEADTDTEQDAFRTTKGAEAHRYLTAVTSDTPESLETAADAMRLMRHIGHEMRPGMFEAFCAIEVDGLSYTRAAKELGVSRNTIRIWVRDARYYLEKRLKEIGVSY